MPSNPVDEARMNIIRSFYEFAAAYEGADDWYKKRRHTQIIEEMRMFEQAIRKQERSRYEGLLMKYGGHVAGCGIYRNAGATGLGSATMNQVLGKPQCNCGWPEQRAALTLSAPDTSVWLVEKDERSRTGQHLWSMWHLDGHVEWTPDANLADQYETQAEAGMAALRITEAKGSPCHATEHVFIEGLSATSAPAEKEGQDDDEE